MSNFLFTEKGFADYLWWQTEDRKTLKRINALLKDIERNHFDGIGKPEPLKYDKGTFWSRRIDEENRLVYRITDGQIEIVQCRGHYDDK